MTRLLLAPILALCAFAAACGGSHPTLNAAKDTVVACAKDAFAANTLVTQARDALLDSAAADPKGVKAFLDTMVLDAASAGMKDAVAFGVCVVEAAKAKLASLAKTADLDPTAYAATMQALDSWESAHTGPVAE